MNETFDISEMAEGAGGSDRNRDLAMRIKLLILLSPLVLRRTRSRGCLEPEDG